eukprot:14611844-Alexandrium_andersonii.AAC.1
MSASLVGSEMCIRDRPQCCCRPGGLCACMRTPLGCHCTVGPSIGCVNSFPCHGQPAALVITIGVRPTA